MTCGLAGSKTDASTGAPISVSGCVDEIGVERVVAGHEDPQCVLGATPGPADLLPEGGPGAGEAGDQHGVEPADVDAELEGVGRGEAHQVTPAQGGLEGAALLGEVAPAVGRDPAGQRGIDLGQQVGRGQRDLLGTPARADEGQGADVLGDQVGEQVGDLAARPRGAQVRRSRRCAT